jgi:hypothetical protein
MTSRRLLIFGLTFASTMHAAELKPETLQAWDRYIQSVDAAMQSRLRPENTFLWTDEAPDRRQQLRAGNILVSGVGENNPKKVPSGLIHHWMGAAFFPNTTLANVFRVVRDYSHFKDYYHPTVIASRPLQETPDDDTFSMLIMNKSLVLKTALETECETSYRQAGNHRWYSMTTALDVQEIENYGQANEHKLPAGEGSGYIWRSHSITRYEVADGGVYVELEAMVLSREIPFGLHWVLAPIVRRLSKGTILTSLRQTLVAVSTLANSRPAPLQ